MLAVMALQKVGSSARKKRGLYLVSYFFSYQNIVTFENKKGDQFQFMSKIYFPLKTIVMSEKIITFNRAHDHRRTTVIPLL